LVIGIAYESDIPKAKSLLLNMLMEDSRVLKDPTPLVAVSELADSSVNLVVRPWCNVSDYWGVYFDTTEKAKHVLEGNGIVIPFPQRDVHIFNPSA
jgi:small conductance mechanosensitive channel